MRNRFTIGSAAAIVMAITLTVTLGKGTSAQTLIDPGSQAAHLRPPLAAKPRKSTNVKSCSEYGAGFVNLPGTGACIKIGGSVTVESAGSRGR